jgi:hypothetical protein
MLDVIGMPLVNVPAFELDCTWRTMIRLTGATSARRWMWSSSYEIDAARVALAAGLEDLPHHVERLIEPVVLEDREHGAELFRREAMLCADVLLFDDQERLVAGIVKAGLRATTDAARAIVAGSGARRRPSTRLRARLSRRR